ncbi:MAG TPA: adenylate/guanylate cyclase domain-containing protein, partial [Acidimicrobiia bacterium]
MPVACPVCATENPDGAKFCLNCGSRLQQVGVGQRERKFVVTLFADLVGSTALGEREDPEVVQTLIQRAFGVLAREVDRHGGTVDKLMGDGMLALFGVPAVHEDDPARAVNAALAMQAALGELNRELAAEGRPQLAMRVGIEAGEVLVHIERPPDLPDRMVTGDSANTAARLQSAAEPGGVVVGPSVQAATATVIEYETLEPLTLKGKADPVPAFRALASRSEHEGGPGRSGLEVPLIGRVEELATLHQTLRAAVDAGRPRLVTVLAPAGVGKSRLAHEFHEATGKLQPPPRWLRGRALAYG